jgi:hypothetical protein
VAKRKKKTDYMAQADRLFSKLIRERDGVCVARGYREFDCSTVLQCAHLVTRSYKSIRTLDVNAVALCKSHHVYFTHRPMEWEAWCERRWPGRLRELKDRALMYVRVDWRAEIERLKREGVS